MDVLEHLVLRKVHDRQPRKSVVVITVIDYQPQISPKNGIASAAEQLKRTAYGQGVLRCK